MVAFSPRRLWAAALVWIALSGCEGGGGGGGAPAVEPTGRVYVLGSSFSRDALPVGLDGEPKWQIYCAQTLDYIFSQPYGHCTPDSTPWPEVLDPPPVVFDAISFQPVPKAGVTLEQDASRILYWLAEEPLSTVAIIHATWPRPADWEQELHQDPDADLDTASYALDYYDALLAELEWLDPGRTYRLTRSNEMLDYIFHDPASPIPFADLFRDAGGHMSLGVGRYLQHNALRQAMDQEVGVDTTVGGVDPLLRDYLDFVVELHPPF